MGNKLLTQYDVQKEPCYYSTELKWRLHSASFKERPDDKLTIFLFEKKHVEKLHKNTKEQILEVMRKDASSLQRLRHPNILSVVEALSEERSTLAFATKPVVGTVAQLLEHNRHELSNLEMKCGLLDVVEAVQFLHQDAKTAHLGLSPHSIFIDPSGKWLVGSFGFSIGGVQWGQLVDCPFSFNPQNEAPGQLSCEPPSRYSAPEMVNMPCKCGLESDMFSLGLLTYELMSTERQPLLRSAPRGFSTHVVRQSSLPPDLYSVLLKVLTPMPNERLTIAAFLNSEFFMDVNVRAIRFLEQLNEKDETQRVTFLKGLPKLLADPQSPFCSQRVLRERVLPRLCSALLFPSLYGVVVPIIIGVLKKDKVSDASHFQAKVWPAIKPLYTAKEIPIEVVTLFLKELDLQVSLASHEAQQAVLLPFLLRCLELQEPVILNEVLEKVPFLHKKFEYRQVKDQILPRMLQLLTSCSVVKVKVQVLMGLTRIFEIFDKTTVIDVILPSFEKLTKMDRTPAVCMCLLGCYDAMSKSLGPKVTAERILPLVCPLLVEESLSFEQWESQMTVCKKLLQRVEAARKKDYDSRKEAQAEAGAALGGGDVGSGFGAVPAQAPAKQAEPQDFESLLFAGTAKAKAVAASAVPFAVPPKAPPPPGVGAPSGGNDLLGGGLTFDTPTPSAPSSGLGGLGGGGGFDMFSSTGVSGPKSSPTTPPAFDPFVGMSSAAVLPTAPPMSMCGMGGCAGGGMGDSIGGGMMGCGMPPGGLPTGGLPTGIPGAGYANLGGLTMGGPPVSGGFGTSPNPMAAFGGATTPGSFGAGPAPAANSGQMRNMAYDPFAEIDQRGGLGGGTAPATGFGGMGGMGYPSM